MADICPTKGIERVLLSTDGSEYSSGAVREAIRVAKKCGASLHVVSVIDSNPEFDTLAPQLVERQEQAVRENLDAIRAFATTEGLDCVTIVHRGEDSYKLIVNEAAKNNSSVIVMGRRGRTGLKRLMMGSVTARVIGHAGCNVLVVPRDAQLGFRHVVVATDGSQYSLAAAAEAIGISRRNGSDLTVVGVVPSEIATPTDIDFTMNQRDLIADKEMQNAESNVRAVKEAAGKEGVPARAFVMSGNPAEAIIQTSQERRGDLIVLGSHGRTGLERLLMGSVAERVIVLASCPVLVVKK